MRHLDLLGKGAAKFFALALLFLSSLSFSALAQQKVVGGVDVDIKDYPWQVALTSSPSGSGFCGGSIIGDSWVLTAAHCVNGDSPSNLYIRVGSSDPFASGGDSYSVNQIIVHPSYSGNSYDFALVEIDGAFAFSAYVEAIDLVSPADISAGVQDGGVMATITGWGTTSSGGSLSSTLQMVEAPIVENNVACGSANDSNGNSGDYGCSQLDETMICAGDLIDGGEDACQGDSGGPLAVRNAANTKWLLIGATSWGYGCADVNYPGVWSKVSYVLDWIDENADTNSENGCMDATACNYDPEAIYDDGSCAELDECGDCGGDGPADGYDCDGNCTTGETLFVEMSDSYGDGWNGNNLIVNGVASTLSSGSSGSTTLCYDSSAGCVDVSCDGGSWQSEVSWTISDENGNQLLAGGAPFTGAFGGADCGPAVPGCTDAAALNYNSAATEDDGSCQYPIDCEGLTAVMIEVGGGSWSSEVSWTLGSFAGGEGSVDACLEDGCHTFNMADSYGDGWNGNTVTITAANGDVLMTGTLETGSEGSLGFGLNTEEDCGEVIIVIDVFGCTDSVATNYNELANIDDGSCQYAIDCDGLTSVVIEVGGGSWAYEVSWTLGSFTGGEGSVDACLEDGCHTFNMADSYGDGWNGNTVTITAANGDVLLTGTLEDGSEGSVGFGLNTEEDCGEVVADIYGCTDSLASNYNELATADDGSCEYAIDCEGLTTVVVTMSDSYGDGWNGNVLSINGQSITLETGSEGTATACVDLAADCIAVTCDGGSWASEVSWTISDGEAILLSGGAPYVGGIGDCGFVYGCTDSLALNYNTEATIDDGSCTYPLAGCTDESALNFNPSATEDDGSCEYPIDCDGLTSVVIEVGGGSWSSEVSWTLGSFAGGEGSVDACLEDGCHTFNMADSYGDGWNGNTVTITAANGDVLLTGTLETGSEGSLGFGLNTEEDCGEVVADIYGCTDSLASNYNELATADDGSCEYAIDCEGLTTVVVTMSDSYGDGWNGNVLSINGQSITLETGSEGTATACVDLAADCIAVTCDGGSWASEVSWTISDGEAILLSGGAPYVGGIGDCGFVYGCTDSLALNYNTEATIDDGSCTYPLAGCTDESALNYNPSATEDDGSCEYPIDCDGLTSVIIEVGGGSWQTEVSWSIAGFEGIAGSTETCLEDGCHTFNMYDSYGDGWNGNTVTIFAGSDILASGTLESGSEGTLSFGLNFEGECGPVYGCTDSLALNYDVDATSNDGSCIYPVIGCTDSLALNYDAAAVEDDGSCTYPMDCEGLMAVMIEVGGGFYDYEISWELNGLEGEVGTTESCLEEGCYTFNMYDSYGDGWNNATVAITTADGESLLSGTLEAGTEGVLFFSYNADCGYTNGCTDSLAINFDSEATFDDGSCIYPLAGCTDESALNYNPSATEDDGSCEYPIDCDGLTSVVIEVGGGSWAYEVSWTLGSFTGGEGSVDACLEDGCHTFNMADSYGDGWNGNTVTITAANGDVLLTGTLEDGSEGSVGFGLNTEEDCGEVVADIYGCTDSLASNYNELATADDGSCEYAIDCEGLTTVVVTMSDSYGDGWNGNVLSINGQSITLETGSEGTATACVDLAADCIAVTCDGGSWASEVSWTISDGEAILLSGGAPYVGGIGDCGFVYGCTDSLALNYNTEATIDDGSCTYPLAGCTDESALNFNPSATEDDGSCEYPIDCDGLTSVVIEVGGGSWSSEVSWTLGSFAGGEGSVDACLEDGCHTFNMADSYGDGWNGNTVTITAANGDVLLTGTLETGSEGSLGFGLNTEEDCGEVVGPILGCTDEAAINYNPEASEDDGSCQYDSNCDLNTVIMTMNDSYGDGWNGNVYVISDGSGAVVAEGTLNEGSNGTDELCLDADCYTMTVGGGSWSSEVSWSISLLSDDIMEIVAEGTAGEDFSFAINSECEGGSEVYGCTDASATNYNPAATEDDGSCEYDSSCTGYEATLTVNAVSFGYEVSWTLVDASGADVATGSDYENNSETVIDLCLEEGASYTFVAEDSYGDGWNGGTFSISTSGCELVSGGLEEGDYAEFAFTASCEGGGDDTPWDVIITGSNHTIVVDGEAIIDLDGMPIEIGDALGVFFTDENGDLQCAGYVTWTGSTNSIAAQGDDSTTDEIDGFVSGSEFVWIVWDASEGVELMASASYSDAMPNQGSFVVNGISALAGLATVPPISEQLISMPEGWSMFSTYMLATSMDMQEMLSPIVDDVVIAKNNEGLAYLPEWGFNGVGDLQVGQGYQIKLLAANEITVVGEYMLPEENPIALTAGWNMIGYLRLEGADAAAILEGVNASGNLVIAKDYNGLAYLPEWDFNGIGDMVPGQGYQLKTVDADVLQYLSNDASYRLSSVEVTENNVSHFSKVVATDNNMTVVIEDAAWDVLPTEGSEVAAFDKAGNLIGSAIYSSPVTVVTVWGDDAMTSEKEGSLVSEAVSFKVFTSGNVLDFTVTEWAEGSSTYNVDAINVASSIEINTVVADAISSDRVLVKVINVLGQEVQLNDESFKGEVLFNVYDDGSVEQFVK